MLAHVEMYGTCSADGAAVRLTASGQTAVPGSAAEFAAAIEKRRTALAGFAKILAIKPASFE